MFRRKKNHYPSILLIQGSLHPASHTAILLDVVSRILSARGMPYMMLDLRVVDLDLYNGRVSEAYGASTRDFIETLSRSDILLFGVPAYATTTPGPLKNVVDLTRQFLKGKKVGLICFSEKGTAYETSLDFMHLLADAGAHTLKPVVLASSDSFRKRAIFDDVVLQLLEELVDAVSRE